MQVDLKFGRSWGDAKHTWEELTGRRTSTQAQAQAQAQARAQTKARTRAGIQTRTRARSETRARASESGPRKPGRTATPAGKSSAAPEKKAPPPLEIELTRLTKDGGPLTKQISLSPDGTLVKDGSACVMAHGTAERVRLPASMRSAR